jgi:5-methylcytosine-specific restriction endonuclease McrA
MAWKSKEARAAYYAAHRVEIAACKKAYYAAHREERVAYNAEHREGIAAYAKVYHAEHREGRAAYVKAHRNTNMDARIGQYKYSAKKRGLRWAISRARAIELFDGDCHFCLKPATFEERSGIDRIDSSVGYVEGNVQSCCTECNLAKGTRSDGAYAEHCLAVVNGLRKQGLLK